MLETNPQVFTLSILTVILLFTCIILWARVRYLKENFDGIMETVNRNADATNELVAFINGNVVESLKKLEDRALDLELFDEILDMSLQDAFPPHLWSGKEAIKELSDYVRKTLIENKGQRLSQEQWNEAFKNLKANRSYEEWIANKFKTGIPIKY